ncbi:MAG: 50S ribosomal protein L15e [Candidatus Micrarchaeota archaeon]
MGAYKYIAQTLQKQYKERDAAYRAKVIAWRAGPAMVKVERPANLARARILGYKPKQGYIVVRARVDKGRRTRRKPMGGRKHKNYYRFVQPQLPHQAIAEQRVNRVYRNMEVLNSYWVGEDGNYKFFEVILADPTKPSVNISSVMRQGKSFRGLTSAGNSRTPSKKKGMNKRLRMKAARRQPYHFEEYVKKEAKPEGKSPRKAEAVPPRHPKPHGGGENAPHKHEEHHGKPAHEAGHAAHHAKHEHTAHESYEGHKPAHAAEHAHKERK